MASRWLCTALAVTHGRLYTQHMKVFVSFESRLVEAQTWLSLGRERLRTNFEVDDFLRRPAQGADLHDSLRDKIERCDIFIALVSESYFNPNSTTLKELDIAIELAT